MGFVLSMLGRNFCISPFLHNFAVKKKNYDSDTFVYLQKVESGFNDYLCAYFRVGVY